QQQISSNMNVKVSVSSTGLVAYYKMDEGTGSSVSDATSHGYTGSCYNNPVWDVPSTVPCSNYTSYLWTPGSAATPIVNVSTSGSYTVQATNAYGCTGTSAPPLVVVNNTPTPTISGDPSACINSTGNIYTTEAGMTSYLWSINGGTITAGSNTNSVTVTWNTAGNQSISVNYTNGNGCSASNATVKSVTVNPATSITGQSTVSQTQCNNNDGIYFFSPITVTATGINLIYQWYSNTSESNSGGLLIYSTQNNNFFYQTPLSGTKYFYCIVTGGCGTPQVSDVSGALIAGEHVSIPVSIPVYPQTICNGGVNGSTVFNSIEATANGTNLTYKWYSNTTPSDSGGTLLGTYTGIMANIYFPPSTTLGTLYYYCKVSGDCAIGTSNVSGAYTVSPATNIISQSTAGQTQCQGGSFTPISVTAIGSNLSYQWYGTQVINGSGANYMSLGSANGAQTNTYTPPASAGTYYYYCEVTGLCGPPVQSAVSGAFIVNQNQAPAIISQSTAGQSQCIFGSFTAITVTATGANLSYQWFRNTIASNSGGHHLVQPMGHKPIAIHRRPLQQEHFIIVLLLEIVEL
ncbi:MAG: hypothetical protein WCH34_10620, partial [Bacteroidota bacterium]